MAALLPNDVLRRHAVPSAFVADLDFTGAFAPVRPANQNPRARPRLVASWHLGASGRPICQWAIGDQASPDLSPS
jgi:hypothetical protein